LRRRAGLPVAVIRRSCKAVEVSRRDNRRKCCRSDETDGPDSRQLREDPFPARARIQELPGLRLYSGQDGERPGCSGEWFVKEG
jgi:hypothetical protein